MSLRGYLLGAAVIVIPASAVAQDFSEAQATNALYAPQISAIIAAGDAAALAQIDNVIDYSAEPVRYNSPTVDSVAAIALFAGCQTQSYDASPPFKDSLVLFYSCPERSAHHRCFTGDLKVSLSPGSPVSIEIFEQIDASAEQCYPSAPQPRKEVGQ